MKAKKPYVRDTTYDNTNKNLVLEEDMLRPREAHVKHKVLPERDIDNLPSCPGIYSIGNIEAQKRLLIFAIDIKMSAQRLWAALKYKRCPNKALQEGYDEDGEFSFVFAVVKEGGSDNALKKLIRQEMTDEPERGYNERPVKVVKRKKMSKATKLNISKGRLKYEREKR